MANRQQQIDALQRHRQALELRQAGLQYQDIADRLGYSSKSSAYKAVQSALRRTLQEPADAVRQLELARLDRMELALWPRALKGDVQAIDRILRICELRARLLGLNAPTRAQLTGADGGPLQVERVVTWDNVIEADDVTNRP